MRLELTDAEVACLLAVLQPAETLLKDALGLAVLGSGKYHMLGLGVIGIITKVRNARSLEETGDDNERYRLTAKSLEAEGVLEVDEKAIVSVGCDNGAYVECWKWIGDDDVEKAGHWPDDEPLPSQREDDNG